MHSKNFVAVFAVAFLTFARADCAGAGDAGACCQQSRLQPPGFRSVRFVAIVTLPASFAYDSYPDNGPERIRCDQGTFARKHGKPWLKSNDWGESGQPAGKEISPETGRLGQAD